MLKIDSLSLDELKAELENLDEPKYKATQVFEWLHGKMADSYDDMSNVSKSTREKLKKNFEFTEAEIKLKLCSKLDETRKYVIMFDDENVVECVYLKYKYGSTACISSQVGCKMGCAFCASTKNGFVRNLTPAEMLKQVYLMQKDTGERIGNIVIMGSGEPLDNYVNVIKFIRLINDERGQNVSLRKITLSTCGIVEAMYSLAGENMPITLAISLHASNQSKRESIIPAAKRYRIDDIMKACDNYLDTTGRRITFEYILIKDFNDGRQDAEELVRLLNGRLCNVNLIPCNSVREAHLLASTDNNIERFRTILCDNGINATVRRELGSDINAACGQLRNEFLEK